MDNFVGWPVLVDDDGSLTVGTVPSVATFDAIRATFADNVYSATNPAIKTKTIIDEVVTARGSLGSLDARLDVALNEDGTPKAVAGQATEEHVRAQQAQKNFVTNGDMELWSAGTTSAPDSWVLFGAGAAILKSGPAQPDTTDLGVGTYCVRLTSGAGAGASLYQESIPVADMTRWRSAKGRNISITARIKTASNASVRISVFDGVVTTSSSYNTTVNAEENLTLLHPLNAAATIVQVSVVVLQGGIVAYIGGITASFSDLVGRWQVGDKANLPSSAYVIPSTVKIGGRLGTNATVATLAATGDLHSYTLPAGQLAADGQVARLTAWGDTNNASGSWSLVFTLGTTPLIFLPGNATVVNAPWRVEVEVIRTGASAQRILAILYSSSAAFNISAATTTFGAETMANPLTMKFGTTIVAACTVNMRASLLEVIP